MSLQESRLNCIKYNVHTVFQDKSTEELSKIAKKIAVPAHLMLFNLDGNMNIAMSIRSAAVNGFSHVWIVGRRKYDARPEVGAKHYVDVRKKDTLDDPVAFFKEQGLQPILLEQGGTPLEEYTFKNISTAGPVCFVVGSESHGIPKSFLSQMKDAPRLTISQYGMIRSLNVSIAASIAMYEYLRQWRRQRKAVLTI